MGMLPEEGPWRASRAHFVAGDQPSDCEESVEHPSAANHGGSEQDPAYQFKEMLGELEPDGSITRISKPRQQLWKIPNCEKVQAMIAVVPDPVHTHLALVFDRSVEALQIAAESSNYVVDRYWLPWQTEPKGEWTDYASYQNAARDEFARLQQPGLLIFRYNGEIGPKELADPRLNQTANAGAKVAGPSALQRATLLYVFLVADTSTAGIDGTQFSKAIEYVKQICDSPGGCTTVPAVTAAGSPTEAKVERRIQIMGPMFSGSLASLRELTRNAGARFTAYSGTVSSICAVQNQHLDNGDPDLCHQPAAGTDLISWVDFRTFVADSEHSVQRFIQFLKDKKEIKCEAGKPEVAILAEAATTYGAAQRSAVRQRVRDDDHRAGTPEDGGPGTLSNAGCSTGFSYPREISSLRNAYNAAASVSSTSGKTADSSRPYLSFTLADQQSNSDEPQDYSGQQGPLSKEAVLMKTAAELRNQKYKYIGIAGTNVLDVLFLGNFLRAAYPDARLFVIGSDLLFERELDNASFIGTLSVSTYPLISRNVDWMRASGFDRLPFSDQYEEGQYNATIHLLHRIIPGHSLKPYEMLRPFAAPSSGAAARLPVWLTVVGTGGYWPVKMLDSEKEPQPPPVLAPKDFSLGWTILEFLLCVLALVHAGVLLTASPVSPRLRDFSMVAALPGQRLFLIHAASAILAFTVAMMAMPAWCFNGEENGAVGWIAYMAEAAIAFLLITCALLDFTYLVRWFREKEARGKREKEIQESSCELPVGIKVSFWIVSHLMVWSVALCLGLAWSGIFDHDGSLYGFFFAYRAVHMASGVSPATPMLPLLASGYLWSIFEIWRLRFNDQLRPRLNPAAESGIAPAALLAGGIREQAVSDALRRYMLGTKYTVSFLLVFGLWLVFFQPSHPFHLFEVSGFGRIYEIFFCTVVLMLLSAGFRFGQVWAALHRLLNEMERSMVRFTFRRLNHSDWSPIWRQGGEEPEWVNMARSIEVLARMQDSGKDDSTYLPNSIVKVTSTAEKIRESYIGLQKRRLIQNWLKDCACWLGWHWRALWAKAGADDAKRASEEKKRAWGELCDSSACFGNINDEVRSVAEGFAGLQGELANALNEILHALPERWKTLHCKPEDDMPSKKDVEVADAVQEAVQKIARNICDDTGDPIKEEEKRQLEQVSRMEAFVAWRYEGFIRSVLGHMKQLLIFMAISFSLLLISLNLYAFEPHQSLIWSLTVIFFVLGLLTIVGLMQIHRDPILSRMSGTQPNDLGLEFYVRIVSLGAGPLIALLATHFPAIGRTLTSLLQPGLEALK